MRRLHHALQIWTADMTQSIDDESLFAICKYPVPNERGGISVARAHRGSVVVACRSGPVERRFAKPHPDLSVTRQGLVYLAHGSEEFGETNHRRRRRPPHRLVPDLAEFDVGNGFAGQVAVDD